LEKFLGKTILYFIGFVFVCYEISLYRSQSNAHIFGGQRVLDLVYTIPSIYDGDPGDYDSSVNNAIKELAKYGITILGHVESGNLDKRFSYFCVESVGSARYYIVDTQRPVRVYQAFDLYATAASGLRLKRIIGDIYRVEIDCEINNGSRADKGYTSTAYMSFFPLEGHNAWFYWNRVSKID
jgi:hypothetical protein